MPPYPSWKELLEMDVLSKQGGGSKRGSFKIKHEDSRGEPLRFAVPTCPLIAMPYETYVTLPKQSSSAYCESCTCTTSAINSHRFEVTDCETLAKQRNRSYCSKVAFGAYNSTANKLRSNLKEWTAAKSVQNGMGKPENELKREKLVAIPMKKELRFVKRTVYDEVTDAIVDGTTHHCLQVVVLSDSHHHVKRLFPDEAVCGVIWIGPNVPQGSQVILGVYVGEVKPSRNVADGSEAYAIEVTWSDPHKRFIKEKAYRKRVVYHRLWKRQKVEKVLPLDETCNIDNEIGFVGTVKKRLVLPPAGYFVVDGLNLFNEIVMINDSRNIASDIRLRSNAKFYQVYYEGWPYYVVASNPACTLLHGEEVLVNCGAAYRFGHLVPLTQKALLEKALRHKPHYNECCRDGWLKRNLSFEQMDEMIDCISDVVWESDDDLPDKDDSDPADSFC